MDSLQGGVTQPSTGNLQGTTPTNLAPQNDSLQNQTNGELNLGNLSGSNLSVTPNCTQHCTLAAQNSSSVNINHSGFPWVGISILIVAVVVVGMFARNVLTS